MIDIPQSTNQWRKGPPGCLEGRLGDDKNLVGHLHRARALGQQAAVGIGMETNNPGFTNQIGNSIENWKIGHLTVIKRWLGVLKL